VRQIRSGAIEIVEVPEFDGMLPFVIHDCPVIVRLHLSATTIAETAGRHISPATRMCERRTLAAHRNWVGVSSHILRETERLFRLAPARARVIYNPVNLPEPAAIEDAPEEFVLFAGAVSERKGAYRVATAARQFLRDHPLLHLVYAGAEHAESGGPAAERVLGIAGEELAGRIRFLGHIPRDVLAGWVARCRALVFPSVLEAFPLVPAEAMLAGKPVIVSNSGPFLEYIRDGYNGLSVDPSDPAQIAASITRIVSDPPFADRLGRAAAETIRTRFNVSNCSSQSEALYRELTCHRN
jgi:glycosyltransferase involved in cell wall biosynthesis